MIGLTLRSFIRATRAACTDCNGDGIGDIMGIRAHLPHIKRLGVDAVWRSPWYVSPMADAGYDVADYRNIDPLFGRLADAEAFPRRGALDGLRVIVDIVPNHCSERHPLFQAALAAGPGSPERQLFHFADEPVNQWRSHFGGSAWTQVPDGSGTCTCSPPNNRLELGSPAVRENSRPRFASG
jgi:alpha-glucosidase